MGQAGPCLIILIHNVRVPQLTGVKKANGSILSDCCEYCFIKNAEADIIDGLFMRNKLSCDLTLFNVPDCHRAVDGGRCDSFKVNLIPVKGSDWLAVLGAIDQLDALARLVILPIGFIPA